MSANILQSIGNTSLVQLHRVVPEGCGQIFVKAEWENPTGSMPHLEMLEHNVEIARSFAPFSEQEMERLRKDVGPAREGLEHNLTGHLDGPTAMPEIFWA